MKIKFTKTYGQQTILVDINETIYEKLKNMFEEISKTYSLYEQFDDKYIIQGIELNNSLFNSSAKFTLVGRKIFVEVYNPDALRFDFFTHLME